MKDLQKYFNNKNMQMLSVIWEMFCVLFNT